MEISPVPLTYVADLMSLDRTRQQYASEAIAGTQVRVARGVYASRAQWGSLDDTERYLAFIRAIALTRKNPPIVSHWSAAALHGLPMVGQWPSTVHITVPVEGGSLLGSRGRGKSSISQCPTRILHWSR